MAAIQITDALQNLAQLTGNSGFTGSGVTGQYNMDADFLLFAKSALGTLHIVVDGKGNLLDSLLDLVHTNIAVQVAQDVFQRAFLGYIAANISLLYHLSLCATTDKRGKDVLGGLHGQMGIAKGFVLDLQLILEETLQFLIGLGRIGCDAILRAELQLADVTQLLTTGSRQSEGILETVLSGRVGRQEVVKALRQTGDDDNGVLVPLVHLDKQLIQRVNLIGIAVWQQFLHVVEEEDAVTGILHILIPLVDKPLVVDGIHHRQLGFVDNLMLVEIVTEHLCQRGLSRTRLTDDDGVDTQTDIDDILA